MEAALFFWLAGISGKVTEAFGIFGFLLTLLGIIGWIVYAVNKGTVEIDYEYDQSSRDWSRLYKIRPDGFALQVRAFWRTRISQLALGLGILLMTVALILPSKDTLYMMAGGYIGQSIIQSDTAAKVKQIVDAHLDEQLKKLVK